MRKFVAVLIFAVAIGLALFFLPRTGLCLGCIYHGQCFENAICGWGCVCVKRDSTDPAGYCAPL